MVFGKIVSWKKNKETAIIAVSSSERPCAFRSFFYGVTLMKNRQRQRENRRRYKKDPRLNASGCMDMTAYKAIRNVTRQEKKVKRHADKT